MTSIERVTVTATAILIVLLSLTMSVSAIQTEYVAEFLRLDQHRLYLWVEGEYFLNQQFVISITRGGEILDQVQVADNAGAVVVSEPLPNYLVNLLAVDSSRCSYTIGFPTDKLADTLLIGLPRDFELQFSTFFAGGLLAYFNSKSDSLRLPIWYEPVLYDSDRDAEIDLSIGAVDLLLWPELDASVFSGSEIRKYPGDDFLEFALITGFHEQDLTATALNYCLRGVLDQSEGATPQSCLMLDDDLETEFPQSDSDARILYSQMREGNRRGELTVVRSRLHAASLEMLRNRISNCGGRLDVIEFSEDSRASAFLAPILQPGFLSELDSRAASLRWVLSIAAQIPLEEQPELPDSICLTDSTLSEDCLARFSNFFARSARVIPLGRQKLIFVAGRKTSVFSPQSETYTINDFYRIKEMRRQSR